jgi:hypothetical protein
MASAATASFKFNKKVPTSYLNGWQSHPLRFQPAISIGS